MKEQNKKTKVEKLHTDKRVVEAKRLMAEALAEYQKNITSPSGPKKQCAEINDRVIQDLERARGRELYYPYVSSGVGKGALVELTDGSVKYDFITGIGVYFFGHHHEAILESGLNAALEDAVMQGNLQQGSKATEVSMKLIELATRKGANLKHCFLTTSGAMANENAFKIMFQKRDGSKRLLAFDKCFTGRTMVTGQVTDNPAYRQGMPKVMDVDYIPFYDVNDHAGSITKSLKVLQSHLDAHPGEHAGMVFELVQGEGGFNAGNKEFFVALMTLLKKNNICVMVDEVQTFGRNEDAFAFQYYGLSAYVDVVTIGKMSQVCATLFSSELNPKPGLLSQTFTSSTSAIYAADAILDELIKSDYLGQNGKINKLTSYFSDQLEGLVKKHQLIMRGPYGLGGMVAFEVFDAKPKTTHAFCKFLYNKGLMTFVAGSNPSRIRMLMPIGAVNEIDLKSVIDIIDAAIVEFEKQKWPAMRDEEAC